MQDVDNQLENYETNVSVINANTLCTSTVLTDNWVLDKYSVPSCQ